MKFSYSWLLDHLDTKLSPEQIGETLTNIGLELENLIDYSSYSKFVVATITDFKKHPNADKLKICQVDNGQKSFQVICGAPNVKKGMRSIFANEGMFIPGTETTLKKGKIRGEISEGMLLSERELNLSDDHEGIIEINKDLPNGTDAVTALDLNDPIFEIGITPNRGDCLGVRGIARDLAAKDIGTLKPLEFKKIDNLKFESPVKWDIQKDDNSCEYVISRFFKNIKNKSSPEWLQKKLLSIGLRPINTLVDITNFITVDLGRPLHVFDADKIGKTLTMRLSNNNEELLALDNKNYKFNSPVTLIADENKALAIGGIIGGIESGCTLSTSNVFIEVALFEPSKVAKAGRSLGINSDARYRFERGLDKEMINEGLEYATSLINELCGGEVSKNTTAGNLIRDYPKINYKFDQFEKIIGIKLSNDEQIKILKKLNFKIDDIDKDHCLLSVPSYRNDILNPIDIIEEIIRVYGYENINTTFPAASNEEIDLVKNSLNNKKNLVLKKIRKSLLTNEFSEIITFSFHSSKAHDYLKGSSSLKLNNAISEEQAYMRNSMLFNHLEALDNNRKKGLQNLNLFEIGPIYHDSSSQENIVFGLCMKNNFKNRKFKSLNFDFYSLSIIVSKIISSLNFDVNQFNIKRSESIYYHPGQSAELFMGKKLIARYGKVHPLILENFPKLHETFAFEVFYENLPVDTIIKKNTFKSLESEYQYSEKDFSFIFEKDQNLYEVYRVLNGIDKKLIQKIEFFDEYYSSEIGEKNKSITFKIIIQSNEKTLDEKDIELVHKNIVDKISSKFKAKLRS